MRYFAVFTAIIFAVTACTSCASTKGAIADDNENSSLRMEQDPVDLTLLIQEQVELDIDFDPKAPFKVGRIRFDLPVTGASAAELARWVSSAAEAGLDAVVIDLNTPGGSVTAGQRVAKVIEESSVPIYCVADGMAASMGMYLLQSCTKRYMTKRSILMAHEPALLEGPGTRLGMRNAQKLLDTMAKALASHICARMDMNQDKCMEKFDNGLEWWLEWEEAKAVKAVDGVVESPQAVVKGLREKLTVPTI